MVRRDVFPLPLTLEEVDCGWLTAALRTRAPGATVRGFEVVDVNHGTCTKVRLRLDLDETARQAGVPSLMMMKAGFEPHSRQMGHMHESEVRGYRDLFPELKLPSPACYFADYDAERRQGVILMEDLTLRGVRFCNPLAPQGYDEVARRLTALARYHAASWESPEFEPGGRWAWIPEFIPMTAQYAGWSFEPSTWRRFIEAPRGAAASVRFHDREWMKDTLDRHVEFAQRRPQCILHGDTHLGNLYVDADGAPGFFDSLPHRGPPASEYGYHIVCALDPADRREWERPLVAHYLAELASAGVTNAPDLETAMDEYAVYMARTYWVFVINESAFQPEAINTAYTARISAAMLDHDTLGKVAAIR